MVYERDSKQKIGMKNRENKKASERGRTDAKWVFDCRFWVIAKLLNQLKTEDFKNGIRRGIDQYILIICFIPLLVFARFAQLLWC